MFIHVCKATPKMTKIMTKGEVKASMDSTGEDKYRLMAFCFNLFQLATGLYEYSTC